MSIKGQSFGNSPTGAHLATAVGNAAGLFTGAWTVAVLMRSANDNKGIFGGWSGGIGGTYRSGILFAATKLYGAADFSSGFGSGLDDGVWRWYGVCKSAGASLRRMHIGVLSTLSWSHGESAGASNYGDQGSCDSFSLGMSSEYALGFDNGDIAAAAVWGSKLTDLAFEAACTKFASDLASSSPLAGWLLPQATSGSAISDFTGGGADEINRVSLATSADPPDFDFTLESPAPQRFLTFF